MKKKENTFFIFIIFLTKFLVLNLNIYIYIKHIEETAQMLNGNHYSNYSCNILFGITIPGSGPFISARAALIACDRETP